VLCLQLGLELFPIPGRESREPIDLLDKKEIAVMGIAEQSKQLGPEELGAL
jgi:hypothetical protein